MRLHQLVGEGKVVGLGQCLVCREIAENVRNIHKAEASVRPSDVKQTDDGNVRLGEIVKKGKIQTDEGEAVRLRASA